MLNRMAQKTLYIKKKMQIPVLEFIQHSIGVGNFFYNKTKVIICQKEFTYKTTAF